MLAGAGYEVLDAASAEDALRLLADGAPTPHLLFADVVLPNMSGPRLAAVLRDRQPDLRVLFASGYLGEMPQQKGLSNANDLVEKPLSPPMLLHKVREILDRATTDAKT